MLTMRPAPAFFMCTAAAQASWKGPRTLVSKMRSQMSR
jgi:hypothetical protein